MVKITFHYLSRPHMYALLIQTAIPLLWVAFLENKGNQGTCTAQPFTQNDKVNKGICNFNWTGFLLHHRTTYYINFISTQYFDTSPWRKVLWEAAIVRCLSQEYNMKAQTKSITPVDHWVTLWQTDEEPVLKLQQIPARLPGSEGVGITNYQTSTNDSW